MNTKLIFNINRKVLDWYQRHNNKLYEKNGLTDRVLKNQIRINTIRAKKNIPDTNNIINNDGYVQ